MRQIKNIVSTGCFFLCLGGWVYSGQALAADEVNRARETVLNAAVAAAAQGDAAPLTELQTAQATPAPAPAEVVPAATRSAEPSSTNLNQATVNVGVDGTVEQINFQDMDINTALHFLSLQSKRNIIASKEVKGTVTANLYNVTFAQALDALLRPSGYDYVEKGNFIYVYTAKELEEIRKRDRRTVNRIFRLNYINAQDASVLIKPMLSSSGIMALTPAAISGLPTGVTDTGGSGYATDDTLVINDFPENLAEVTSALKQIDIRPKQVLVESTILRAALTEDNALGVDFISLSGFDFSTLANVFGTNKNGAQVLEGNQAGNVVHVPDNVTSNTGTDFTSKVPQGGLSVGIMSNHISVLIRALEEITDTTVVANPKILTHNKHKGEVFIGDQSGYKTTTTSQTTTQETVTFLDTGTKLIFRPMIQDDGYVRMEVHPEDSSGGVVNGLPQKTSTEVTSNIMVKDGRTVVIGGLFREQTTAGRGQVPVLGNIPVLGVPFRRTNDTTKRVETIVLLTPHIINDDTSLYEASEKQAADVNRMMLGNRAGLQPWGRDRIAQLWYGKAQEAADAGCRDKALMFIEWSLNTNPRFVEALKFREKLTAQKMQEPDSSAVSRYVRDVLRDDAATTPDSGGSGHYPAPVAPAAPVAPVPPAAPVVQ
jgi:type IV pilus secretin PilQ/predicted competence protein